MIETVQSEYGFGSANRNRVPKRQWRKWSSLARLVFNETYGAMMANPEHYWHPMAQRVGKRLWKTTAWNAAWIAADAVRDATRQGLKVA
jgi:hypothetical protein